MCLVFSSQAPGTAVPHAAPEAKRDFGGATRRPFTSETAKHSESITFCIHFVFFFVYLCAFPIDLACKP
jgi:hypothetical protein